MKIAMSGATGFVGKHLSKVFKDRGWDISEVDRNALANREVLLSAITDAAVIINLAGAPIIKRWSEQYKRILYSSRIDTTHTIVEAMNSLDRKPDVLISTSAIGIYESGEQTHTEETHRLADNFLGHLAQDWEAAAQKAQQVRIVIARFGVIIGPGGGALQQMLLPFKGGFGGTIGDGKQAFSWIHIDDIAGAIMHMIEDKSCKGVYNFTAPGVTTNKGLTQALASALHRPAVMRVPHIVMKMQYGEGAQVLTEGQRVLPQRLLQCGYQFKYENLQDAIRASL